MAMTEKEMRDAARLKTREEFFGGAGLIGEAIKVVAATGSTALNTLTGVGPDVFSAYGQARRTNYQALKDKEKYDALDKRIKAQAVDDDTALKVIRDNLGVDDAMASQILAEVDRQAAEEGTMSRKAYLGTLLQDNVAPVMSRIEKNAIAQGFTPEVAKDIAVRQFVRGMGQFGARKIGSKIDWNEIDFDRTDAIQDEARNKELQQKKFNEFSDAMREENRLLTKALQGLEFDRYEGLSEYEKKLAMEDQKTALRRRPDGTLITDEDAKRNPSDQQILLDNYRKYGKGLLDQGKAQREERWQKFQNEVEADRAEQAAAEKKILEEKALEAKASEQAWARSALEEEAKAYAASKIKGFHPITGVPMSQLVDAKALEQRYIQRRLNPDGSVKTKEQLAVQQQQRPQTHWGRPPVRDIDSTWKAKMAQWDARKKLEHDTRLMKPSQRAAILAGDTARGGVNLRAAQIYEQNFGGSPVGSFGRGVDDAYFNSDMGRQNAMIQNENARLAGQAVGNLYAKPEQL